MQKTKSLNKMSLSTIQSPNLYIDMNCEEVHLYEQAYLSAPYTIDKKTYEYIKPEILQEHLKHIAEIYLSGANTDCTRLDIFMRINLPLAKVIADFLNLNTIIHLKMLCVEFHDEESELPIINAIINSKSIRTLQIKEQPNNMNNDGKEEYIDKWAKIIHQNKSITCIGGGFEPNQYLIDRINSIYVKEVKEIFNNTYKALDNVCPIVKYIDSDEDNILPKINEADHTNISPLLWKIMCASLPTYIENDASMNTGIDTNTILLLDYTEPCSCDISNPRKLDDYTTDTKKDFFEVIRKEIRI